MIDRLPDSDQDPPRPIPRRSIGEVLSDAIGTIETPRLIAIGIAAIGVVLAGTWLLKSSPPPVEAGLATLPTEAASDLPADLVPAQPSLVVHVAGAVSNAGVHTLPPGSRVVEAISAAGGTEPNADPNALNLAALLVDGQRVYVPLIGEPVMTPISAGSLGDEPININTASSDLLERLPGVGPTTASAIIDDRNEHGVFHSVDDLDRVPGIGPATIDRLRDRVAT